MSEWIPTSERLPNEDEIRTGGTAWVTFSGTRSSGRIGLEDVNNRHHVAWMSCEVPEPYVPPKPKRRTGILWTDNDKCEGIELLPGDPDPDVVMEVMEDMKESKGYSSVSVIYDWINRIEESRSK